MIDLMKKGLPECIVIAGESFSVHTDFRIWMHFCCLFERWDKRSDLDISFLFVDRVPAIETEEDIKAILRFASPSMEIPKSRGGSEDRSVDYEIDATYIYAAFLGQYGIDLLGADMHWHRFLALLYGLKDTKFNDIVGYRCYEGKDKELLKLKNMWQLPVIFTETDRQAKEKFDEYFE